MDKKKIVPAFWPFFKEHGYKKWGTNKFYKIENHIAYCFLLERPSIIVYPTYFILPLYIPSDYVYLDYGNRLCNMIYGVSTYNLLNDDSTFMPWVDQVQGFLENRIFPFYESVGSPEKLIHFMDQYPFEARDYFSGHALFRLELKAYTCFYLSDFEGTRKYIDYIRSNLEREFKNFPNIMEEHTQRVNRLEELMKSSQEERETFIHETINHTLETCFRIRPQDNP